MGRGLTGLIVWAWILGEGLGLWAQEARPEPLPVAPKPVTTLSDLPIPKDQIVVMPGQGLDRTSGRWVLLSLEEYHRLVQQAQGEKPPSDPPPERFFVECHYQGEVAFSAADSRPVLLLRLRLILVTVRPEQKVELGLKGARLTRAELDNGPVRWAGADPRLTLEVPSPGRHELLIETPLSVTYDDKQRQFTAILDDAPPAAITTFEVVIPGKVQTATVKDAGTLRLEFGNWPAAGSSQKHVTGTRVAGDALGTLQRLEFTWQPFETVSWGPAGALSGQIEVLVRGRVVETTAQLSLTVRRGTVQQIRLRLPPGATQVSWSDENRSNSNPLTPDAKGMVTLKPPAPLTAGSQPTWSWTLSWRQMFPEKGPARIAIGQLQLVEPSGYQQSGTIEVSNPDNWPISYHGDAQPLGANRFQYVLQPVSLEMHLDESSALPPVVELQAEYTVWLEPGMLLVSSKWQAIRKPLLNLQELEIDWPDGFQIHRQGLPVNLFVTPPEGGKVKVRFLGGAPLSGPNGLQLEGWLPLENESTDRGFLQRCFSLPWLAQATGQQYGRLVSAKLQLVSAKVQFRQPDKAQYELSLESKTQGLLVPDGKKAHSSVPIYFPAELLWDNRTEPQPIVLDMKWRPRLPQVKWEGRLFLTRDQWELEQVLGWRFSGPTPPALTLRLPPQLRELKQAVLQTATQQGQSKSVSTNIVTIKRVADESEDGSLLCRIELPSSVGRECELRFMWKESADLSRDSFLKIPMIRPERETGDLQEARLLCWHPRDLAVTLSPQSPWQVQTPQPAHAELPPAVTLQAIKTDATLQLQIRPRDEQPFLADRMLVLISPASSRNANATVQVKYWISQMGSHRLTIRVPTEVTLTKLAGNEVELTPVSEREEDGWRHLEIVLEPRWLSRPFLLEMHYRQGRASRGPIRFRPPQSAPPIEVDVVRWGLVMEPAWRPVYVNTPALAEQSWRWQLHSLAFWNWLAFPFSFESRQSLEAWLTRSPKIAATDTLPLYTWRQFGSVGELELWIVSSHVWILSCSLAIVLIGAVWLYAPNWLRIPVVAASVLFLIGLAWFSTWTFLALLAGCLPGILVTALMIVAVELHRWWWEKRLEWLAGFAPVPLGSTVQQPGVNAVVPPGPAKPRSTVEAPAGQLPHPLPSSTGQLGNKSPRPPTANG